MATPPLLEADDLTFTYAGQDRPTLEHIDLTVQAGELVVLAGATGSGKSTLLNCLTGVAPEHTGGRLTGNLRYRGQCIASWTIRQRSRAMGMMLQNVETQLFTDRVSEELIFGLENWNLPPGDIQDRTQTALCEFDLASHRDRAIHQLSAGQKQRLLLACLSTHQPSLLLLDEPFRFLDQAGVHQLLDLIQRRTRQGQGVLVIEHRLELLKPVCDRAYRLASGRLFPWDLGAAPSPRPLDAAPKPPPKASGPIRLQTENLSWGGYPAFLQPRGVAIG
ncbi:energy-coupling factor ABC transporter ATP-binding protein [filamentous cyanobacterium CCP5]|nr:energy-coupling factor ABC transporter ATP-binding protein [filamentous cyanobacterium CCP5]